MKLLVDADFIFLEFLDAHSYSSSVALTRFDQSDWLQLSTSPLNSSISSLSTGLETEVVRFLKAF